MLHAGDGVEYHDLPLVFRETAQRGAEYDGFLCLIAGVEGQLSLGDIGKGKLFPQGALVRANQIPLDGEDPGQRFSHGPIEMGGGADFEIGLHHHVLSVVMAASEGEGVGVEHPVGGAVKGVKGLALPPANTFQQRFALFIRQRALALRHDSFHCHHQGKHGRKLPCPF